MLDMGPRVALYQEMIDRYSDSHPFLLVKLADLFVLLNAGTLAIDLYRKAQGILSTMGIVESGLDVLVEDYGRKIDEQVKKTLDGARQNLYYQTWKTTKVHLFPTSLPQLPLEAQAVKSRWQELTPKGSSFFDAYLKKLAIDTNHIESTFLLTEGSTQDLIRRGFSEGVVNYLPESSLQDPATIKRILNDTLAAYNLVSELCENVDHLNKDIVCRIHSRLMKNCQFSGQYYIPAGKTRTETRKTVIVAGSYNIECCPFPEVDAELEYICKMTMQWAKSWRNPFATASWIHLVLVRCHPFEDGNGRLVRLLASIPLLQHGYPPISISLKHRADYYLAINKAYDGDHTSLSECILNGMKDTISSVESLG
ncbi:fido domain-containing protein [Crassisporium funariophilum]|nr:fido domain-containing protein [Crassisporium funariophilum]